MKKMRYQNTEDKPSLLMTLLVAVIMFLGVVHNTFSQVYPVNATTQIAPPYSVFLSDYVAPGSEQLKLNLFLRDLTEPLYDVRIRMVIEGQGVRIETSPAFNPPPVTIEGGVSTWLDANDLAPWFDSRNLIFSGYSKAQFERSGRLPEGFYQFCFTVYDYRHPEIQLSQSSCQSVWLVRPDPPMLNQPACAAELKLNEMQQSVIFQWTPMAISPNSSFTTDYIFRLYEIRPEGRNPADIVLSSNPIYEIQTPETNLLYGVAEPPLIPGMEYVWQVQAIDLDGRDRFKNNGYSKVCTFKVAQDEPPLPEPDEFKAWALNERMGMASWKPSLEPDGYTLEYRLSNNPRAEWFVEELQLPLNAQLADSMYVVLNNLMPQTQYEVRIGSKRGAFVSSWTETKRFTTYPPRIFACGDAQDLQQPLNTTPLISAIRGEVFTVGDFKMRLIEVKGGNGAFSGLGSIETPFLGFNMAVKFDNIRVNELYQVVAGEVIALSDGIDGLIDNWEDEDEDDGTGTDEDGSGSEDDDSEDDFDGEDITYDGEIGDVTVGDDGVITVTDEDGTAHTYEQPVDPETGEKEDVRFTDSSGDTWIVDSDGNVTQGNDNTAEDDAISIEKELIKEALEYFKQEINNYLENSGKGPLDDVLIRRIQSLPDCLPKDEERLQVILEKVDELINDPDSLLTLINEDDINGPQVEQMVNQLKGKRPPYSSELSEEQWDQLIQILCPYLVEEEERPELVTIVPITDEEFTAGIDDDKLEISYSIKTTDKYPLKYAKLEIYKNDGTLAYINDQDIKIAENAAFHWDGKMNQGDNNGEYIRYDESPFEVKILSSESKNFTMPFSASALSKVHPYADEWNDASDEIKKRVVVNNAPYGTTKFEYYMMLREQMIDNISIENIDGSGPLGYMDKNDTTFSFLGKQISTHKNYQPILKEIEDKIIEQGDYNKYKNKYSINDYTIRFMNHSRIISDHSFGFAIDIDAIRNPQISEQQNLFLKVITNVDFWYTDLILEQMKNASDNFKQRINSQSLSEIISGFNYLTKYDSEFKDALPFWKSSIVNQGNAVYSEYQKIYQRTSYLINELWFENKVSEEMLNELRSIIPEKCTSKIEEVDQIIEELKTYHDLLNNGFVKAYLMKSNFHDEYIYWNGYITNTMDILKVYKEAFEKIISEVEETKTAGYLPASFGIDLDFEVIESFDSTQINDFISFLERVDEILGSSGMGRLSFGNYVEWLNRNGTQTAISTLGENGFFNLDNGFVEYFLNSGKIDWGGNWTRKRDWMHFQPLKRYRNFE
ncbi:hypothetical protein C900_02317 [Fulvivirga imtechensis AK7]|uniref:Fibronectin type-III domain-containing protein n=1 Tax=Fulvivirga imtechensis AK7 TaxID=1237149 RepID=L8JX08_9BACT|nr:hypothetical protein [Fulvivirga imtechensis]ELR71732.1 hypothetical protein C900_02317 [Fulvivirga imtechensis AK7]